MTKGSPSKIMEMNFPSFTFSGENRSRSAKTFHEEVGSSAASSHKQRLYLPPGSRRALRSFKYKGQDKSYIYKLIYQPLCRRSVGKLPNFIAANMITVLALVIGCVPYLIHFLYHYFFVSAFTLNHEKYNNDLLLHQALMEGGGDDTAPPFTAFFTPPWVLILNAVVLILYQYLDNLDGHQARHLNMASPIGLWMDHGCDAFHSVVMSFCVCSYLSLGASWKTIVILHGTLATFYMNTWEEYHIGALVLPVINGPNEGILILCLAYFWTSFVGSSWWLNELTLFRVQESSLPAWLSSSLLSKVFSTEGGTMVFACQYNSIFVLIHAAGALCTSSANALRVLVKAMLGSERVTFLVALKQRGEMIRRACSSSSLDESAEELGESGFFGDAEALPKVEPPKNDDDHIAISKTDALLTLIPVNLLLLFGIASAWYTPVLAKHPYLFCWTVGLLYTYITICLMQSHMCHARFNECLSTRWWYRMCTIYFATLFLPLLPSFSPQVQESMYGIILTASFFIILVMLVHYAFHSASEMGAALQVSLMTVPKEKRKEVKSIEKRKHVIRKMKKSLDLINPEQKSG